MPQRKRILGLLSLVFLILTLPVQVFAYTFDFETADGESYYIIEAHGFYDYKFAAHQDWLSPHKKVDEANGEYTWGEELSAGISMSDDTPVCSASASSSLQTNGIDGALITMGGQSTASANVTDMQADDYFGVEGYSDVELMGYFNIEADPGEPSETYTTFDFLLEGSQSAKGDFGSLASAFFGVYDPSWEGDWKGYADPLLIGYYQYGDELYEPKYSDADVEWNWRTQRVTNDSDVQPSDSSPSLTLPLTAGEKYGFYMWLETNSYGSENYWPAWEGHDGFAADGKVIGNANSTFDIVYDTFELTNVNVAPIPEPATMVLLGTGLLGMAAFRRKRK